MFNLIECHGKDVMYVTLPASATGETLATGAPSSLPLSILLSPLLESVAEQSPRDAVGDEVSLPSRMYQE